MNAKAEMKSSRIVIPWNADTEYALGFCRILGHTLGIWPFSQNNISSYIRIGFVIVTQLSMSIRLLVLLLTKGNCGDITDIVDVLSLITAGWLSILKVLIPKIYHNKMYILINTAVEDWNNVNNEKSRRTMLKYAYIERMTFIIFMSGVYTLASPLIIFRLPFIVDLWNDHTNANITYGTPLGPSCWISSDISSVYYTVVFIIQSIQLFITATAYIGCDTYFFSLAIHVCGQFELLYKNFKSINKISSNREQKRIISKFIQRHQHLLLLANNFENVYNVIILCQVLGTTLLICVTSIGLLISLPFGDTSVNVQLTIRIYLFCTQLFIYCYIGEQLKIQIEKLQVAVYNCNWYNMSYKRVRDMIYIMSRANYPFHLTAGKMCSMNHENFTSLIKGMGSYFSILRLMFIEE